MHIYFHEESEKHLLGEKGEETSQRKVRDSCHCAAWQCAQVPHPAENWLACLHAQGTTFLRKWHQSVYMLIFLMWSALQEVRIQQISKSLIQNKWERNSRGWAALFMGVMVSLYWWKFKAFPKGWSWSETVNCLVVSACFTGG